MEADPKRESLVNSPVFPLRISTSSEKADDEGETRCFATVNLSCVPGRLVPPSPEDNDDVVSPPTLSVCAR